MTLRALFLLGVLCLSAAPVFAQYDDYPGDVPYVPTPTDVVEAMLKLGGVTGSDVLYDLGCGDGRIVVTAAQKFGARGVGIDLNPERIKEADANAKQAGVTDKTRFIEKNLFDADVSEASIVTLYLLPSVNLRIRPMLLRQLKTGSRIVSHSFDMDDWKPEKTVEVGSRRIHFWTVTEEAKRQYGGAVVDGEWTFTMPTPNGDMDAKLVLKTEGKTLSGTFTFAQDRRLEIQSGTVEGNQLKFVVKRDRSGGGSMTYNMTGTVNGDSISGTTAADMDGQQVNQNWSAKRK
jgi:SAM-dependent methyltransferase